MWDFLESIENSGFASYIRETPSVLGYSTILALHTFGMAFLVGLSAVIALRVLGVVPDLPVKPLEKLWPTIVMGFWVNALTGLVLTALAPRSFLTNPDFYLKLVAIALAIVSLLKMKRYAFGEVAAPGGSPVNPAARPWAGAMLLFWAVAITAGRLTAYANNIRIESAIAIVIAVAVLLLARYLIRLVLRSSTTTAGTRSSSAPATTSTR
jgi:hypothetical protein